MREVIDQFSVDPDDLYIAADDEDLERWSRERTCLLPIGRKYDPDDPQTATWNPRVTKEERESNAFPT
jgi:hypothetical protein